MKKIIPIALVLVLTAALLCSCGVSDVLNVFGGGPEGTYVVKSIGGQPVREAFESMYEEYDVDAEDILEEMGLDSFEEFIVIELKSGGAAVLTINMGSENKTEGTWKKDGDKITIIADGDPQEFTLKGNELSYNDGSQEYVFVKK